VREELGVDDDTVLAVMVANVREWKGQHVVLAALAQMDQRVRARLRVCFIGAKSADDESYGRELEATVATHNLEACVRFLGSRTDVPDLFTAADIALHASIRPEPGGVAVLEAMAFGVPMVASNTGAPAETVTAEAGFTHDTNHPEQLARILTSLVENQELRRRLAEGARRRAQDFSIDRYVSGIVRTYDALLSRPQASSDVASVTLRSTVPQ
jgi:glycosyltransferase involved in cell wall biosynthesis